MANMEQQLQAIGVTTSAAQLEQLEAYLALLQKWNKAFNLTAITEYQQMVALHIVDSASVYAYIKGESFLDVGTGAGLPGVVLAILYPDKQFTLLDSNSKKIRFLRQCKTELQLDNIFPVHARVENYQNDKHFDGVISRAFASLEDFIDKCAQHLKPNGVLLAMKGREQEQTKVKQTVHTLPASDASVKRHLIIIKKADIDT